MSRNNDECAQAVLSGVLRYAKNAIGSLFGRQSCDFYDEVCFRKLDHSQKTTLTSKISQTFWMIYYHLHMVLSAYIK